VPVRERSQVRETGQRAWLRPLGIALAVVAGILAAAWWSISWSQRSAESPEVDREAWAALLGGARLAGGRLWRVPWGPRELDAVPPSREIVALVRHITMEAEHECRPRCLANLALTKLMRRQNSTAVELLERAVDRAPEDAALWSELAVARLAVAKETGSALALVGALAADERALALEPDLAEALFNRALTLQRLHLAALARGAWSRYLGADVASPWAEEARCSLAALPSGTERQQWREALARLAAAGGRSDDVVAAVKRFRQETRLQIEETTLADWGKAWLKGDAETARHHLRLAEVLGQALVEVGSDPLIAAAVRSIRTAEARGDPESVGSLARGHLAYARGMELYKASEDRRALQRFDAAVQLLSKGRSPFVGWARFRAQLCRYYDGDNAGVLAASRALLRDRPTEHYAALEGRASLLAGMASLRLAHLGRCIRFYRQALAAFSGIGETEHVAAAHFMLAEALQMEGNLEEAWDQRLEALALAQPLGDSIYYYNSLYDAAEALRLAGEHGSALAFEDEMVRFARSKRDPLLLTETLTDRARTRSRLGGAAGARRDLATAGAWLQKVPAGERRLRLDTALRLAQAEMAAGSAEALAALTGAIQLARERRDDFRLPELYELRARSWLLEGRLEEAASDLLAGIEECERQRERILVEQLPGVFLDQWQAVFEEMVRLQLRLGQPELALHFAERGRTRNLLETLAAAEHGGEATIAGGVASAAMIARALPPKTGLLEFAVFEDCTVAWVVGREGLSVRELPVGGKDLRPRVDELRRQIEREEGAVPRESGVLFELLLRPLIDLLDRYDELVVVAGEPLQTLPFAALWDARGRRFLVERWALAASPSATLYLHALLQDVQLPRSRPSSALVVTAPLLAGTEYANLRALPFAAAEARQVAASYPRADLLAGGGASREAFREQAPRHEVVHVATHAVLNERYPLLSAIPMTPTSSDEADGALYAHDIYRMRLAKTRLVVLAACDTGRGRLSRSEGVDSLARAFLAAGVPAVVSSLWPIDDEAAERFFVEFHRRVAGGEDPVRALRAAQLALLKETSANLRLPRSWAAYQLIGGVASDSVH
jgi:CHAT domain-containing protein